MNPFVSIMTKTNRYLEVEVNDSIKKILAHMECGLEDNSLLLTEASPYFDMKESDPVSSVYIPSYIAHSLSFGKEFPHVKKIISYIIDFLSTQRENDEIWRFYGKSQQFPPPDFDDTCCVLAALVENDVKIETTIWQLLSEYRSESGLYYTWLDNNLNRETFNHTDGAVNVNILFFAGINGRKIKEIIKYANLFSAVKEFYKMSVYSVSDYSIIYMTTRAFKDGKINELKPAVDSITDFLLKKQLNDGSWGNNLDTVLALCSLVNSGYSGDAVLKALRHLFEFQNKFGQLNSCAFFKDFSPKYFGSAYLTSAIFLESLIKFKKNGYSV
jgi:hypothetical protein